MHNSPSRIALITTPINTQWQERLQQRFPQLQIEARPTSRVTNIPNDIWQNVEMLLTFNTLPAPEQAPHLRWVQLYSAGANQVLDHPLFHSEVTFTTASGVHAINIAEYVFTMQLAWFHRLLPILEWQRKAEWAPERERNTTFMADEVRGKTIGIVGYGSIGREVARLAQAFGMRILALQRSSDHRDHGFIFPGIGDPEGTLPERYYTFEQFHELLHESDVVVIAVPLTPQTRNMFDGNAFNAMKSSALLINVARGEVCDEQALLQALREQRIAGAALDVTSPEPLPSDHPLWRLPNVIISPHISGETRAYDERILTIFEANMQRYLSKQSLYNEVNKERQY